MTGAVFSPNGRFLATRSLDGTARTWRTTLGKDVPELRGGGGHVYSAEPHPDGVRVLTAGEADGTAWLWDRRTERQLEPLYGHQGIIFWATLGAQRRRGAHRQPRQDGQGVGHQDARHGPGDGPPRGPPGPAVPGRPARRRKAGDHRQRGRHGAPVAGGGRPRPGRPRRAQPGRHRRRVRPRRGARRHLQRRRHGARCGAWTATGRRRWPSCADTPARCAAPPSARTGATSSRPTTTAPPASGS